MSSESTSYYIVQRNAEIEEAARQLALQEIQRCSTEFAALREKARSFEAAAAGTGVTIALPAEPDPTSSDTSTRAGAEMCLRAWRQVVADSQRIIDQAHGRAASVRFLRSLGAGSGPRTASDVVRDVGAPGSAPGNEQWLASIERILTDATVTSAEMDQLLEETQRLRDSIAQGGNPGPAVESFRQRVAAASAACAARRHESDEAGEVLASLAGLASEEAESVRAQLIEVQSGRSRLPAGLRDQVTRVAQRARAAADDRWVATLVEQELVRLGYQVEVGFSTASGEVTHLQARRRDWVERDGTATHDVQLEFDPRAEGAADGTIEITVRHAPDESLAAAQRNLAAENRWCDDFLVLLHRLKQHEVTLHIPRESRKRPQAATARGRNVLTAASTAGGRTRPAPRSRQRERG
jgi:hypothetical protein